MKWLGILFIDVVFIQIYIYIFINGENTPTNTVPPQPAQPVKKRGWEGDEKALSTEHWNEVFIIIYFFLEKERWRGRKFYTCFNVVYYYIIGENWLNNILMNIKYKSLFHHTFFLSYRYLLLCSLSLILSVY